MSIATYYHVIKHSQFNKNINKIKGIKPIATFGVAILLSAFSLSTNATTLISATDYLDCNLPKHLQERCIKRGNCPKIDIKYLKTNHDWLNGVVNGRINDLIVNSKMSESASINNKSSQADVRAAIDDFAASQFADLPADSVFTYRLMIEPKYIGHVDNFELFEIHSYVFTGGAHGMPYSEYLVFDSTTKQQVQLVDMLQKGKKSDFEALAYDAYKQWVGTVASDTHDYEQSWPFVFSDNITLTDKGIDIRYQHYSIGPYAYGMPVLSIPYDKLNTSIKPYFMPQ
ncbi:RsiV family protein [Psychrobacter sp. FBL11]|uniref:RsiV family protein n=1 Tax=Psychrobacter saeujeotis TaxID=3143436 RepID=A0ABU9XBV0_9GAMM|nr:RsiV family protein [uncultured Psychrobacter sp.]